MSDGGFAPIQTERLVLRRFAARDAAAFRAYRDDPEVARWQGWSGCSEAEAEAFVADMAVAAWDRPGQWFQVAIADRATDGLVGDIGVHVLADDARLVELGATLAAAAQGHGYATEALDALIRHLFVDLGKHRLQASLDPRNRSSAALFERLGFRREAQFRRSVWIKGEWCDDDVYALLAEDRGGRDAA
ncbi:aminoglycoside 6'-N-acetyltransferase [Inquilinus ginsengisoli]|uniref:Aminoglycoside 6'-N-acetyltransferase n=1 Tax=Inquilinus ginsengisoli TaxID=363840 RepID=A0ABU1JYI9_9PROT|nr:GNAT family protein [Inquilinus ginsengisoli]MDR6293069.1 aminoglycoside 6'-N-acetyltransferase [Inquilinus ginsengisoli]